MAAGKSGKPGKPQPSAGPAELAREVERQLALVSRGAVKIETPEELRAKLARSLAAKKPLRIKLGMDPTAPDIHLGHTVVLRKLRTFQELGHKCVLIIGDYTALVGDPSGQSATRPTLAAEEIEKNLATYLAQVGRILDVSALEIVRNGEWFAKMSFRDVLALAGRATVAQMLARDDFKARYAAGRPLGVHELLYPLMQGFDSVEVRADVELGGTDQTFNLLVGRDFQQQEGQEPQVTLTLPLLVGLDGTEKMSKSLGNYIGVGEPPQEIFGKVMSLPDSLMLGYYELLTDVALDEAQKLVASDPRAAKERLGVEIVAAYHPRPAAEAAAAEFRRVFSKKETPEEIPEVRLEKGALDAEGKIGLLNLLKLAGHAPSTSEARRLVAQGAVSLDGERLSDPRAAVAVRDGQILRTGKRRWARIRVGRPPG